MAVPVFPAIRKTPGESTRTASVSAVARGTADEHSREVEGGIPRECASGGPLSCDGWFWTLTLFPSLTTVAS